MKYLVSFAISLALLPVAAFAQTSTVTVTHPWARASAGAATTGAAYLTLADTAPDHLVSVSTPLAKMAELHETIDDKGIMRMRPVPHLALEPGKPVTLSPGGYHVMLMGLAAPLKAGDQFPMTLTFEHAPPVTVTVEVEAMGAQGMGGAAGHGGMEHAKP